MLICRFAYHQRICDNVPETFAAFIPEKPQPEYKYDKEGAGRYLAHSLPCVAMILSVCCCSVQFRMVSTWSGEPICSPPHLSDTTGPNAVVSD